MAGDTANALVIIAAVLGILVATALLAWGLILRTNMDEINRLPKGGIETLARQITRDDNTEE